MAELYQSSFKSQLTVAVKQKYTDRKLHVVYNKVLLVKQGMAAAIFSHTESSATDPN